MRRTLPLFLGFALCFGCSGGGDGGDSNVADAAPADSGATDSAAGSTDADAAPSVPLVFDGFFPIGTWYQEPDSFATWKARGVNIAIWAPPENVDAWDAEAAKTGLRTIRLPRGDGKPDLSNAQLFAWAQPDEPDGKMYSYPFATVQKTYDELHALGKLPVYLNFAGENLGSHWCYVDDPKGGVGFRNCYNGVTEDGVSPQDPSVHYFTAGDILAEDIYPNNSYNGDTGPRLPLDVVGKTLDTLNRMQRDAGMNKPTLVFIETSNQAFLTYARAPTADELREEVWDAILHGARGICYFPEIVPNNSPMTGSTETVAHYALSHDPQKPCGPQYSDGTPCAVADEMTKQNALIGSLAKTLQGPIDPPSASIAVAAPFEAAWRVDASGTWFFVLNTSNATTSAPTFAVTGANGSLSTFHPSAHAGASLDAAGIHDAPFTPYELRVYVVK